MYKNCHEIMIDHVNNKPNKSGRLVFDFDIKINKTIKIPRDFKSQIENTIFCVISEYYQDIDIEIVDFIWSTSQNPTKFSKHLTVKNIYFDDWIKMSKIFYELFSKEWDKKYNWISSKYLIDVQIVRNRASLRMVGSEKINGYPLVFDNNQHKLTDSLIKIYFKNHRDAEQLVTYNNIIENVRKNFLFFEKKQKKYHSQKINISKSNLVYDKNIYEIAFDICQSMNPDVFLMGKISSQYMSLLRKKSCKCILSGRVHENENAYCHITRDTISGNYTISYGCYRNCTDKFGKKYIQLAVITNDGAIILTPVAQQIIDSYNGYINFTNSDSNDDSHSDVSDNTDSDTNNNTDSDACNDTDTDTCDSTDDSDNNYTYNAASLNYD